jgi:translation initiation factor 2 alpha subunit (eIF-2alpha)
MQFYDNKIPKFEDYVIAKVTGYDESFGLYCELVEYSNIPAVILNGEISKYKINYSKKYPVGKFIVCIIYMIDKVKNHINLSLKKISEEFTKKQLDVYETKCRIYKLFKKLDNREENQDYINNMIIKCMTYIHEKEDHEYTYEQYYNLLLDEPCNIFNYDDENKFDDKKDAIILEFKKHIRTTNLIMELQFKLLILENGFTSKIKEILELDNEVYKVNCISSPIYSILISTKTVDEAKLISEQFKNDLNDKLKKYTYIFEDVDELKVIKERTFIYL